MSLGRKLLNLFRTKSLERDIDDEICFHLEERIRQNRAHHLAPEEAARLAHDQFGSVERAKVGMRAARVPRKSTLAAIGAAVLVCGLSLNQWIATGRVYELREGITAPVPILAPTPHYTDAARLAKIQGVVRLQCVVRADGGCGDATVLRSLDTVYGLDDEAVRTMRRWRFKPALLERKTVPVRIRVDMKFALR
jgi:TonB family protein